MANLTNSAKLIAEMNKKANKSEIPAVYDSTVTFKINNGTGKTMSTNQPAPSTVNLEIDKSTVGLGNVDNTSDANKPVSTAQQAALDLKADKSTTYTKTEVDSAISSAVSSAYTYKGSVADYDSLPASGNTTGDVRNVEDTGMNYAWTGEAWDALGTTVDLSAYQEKLTAGNGISIESVVSSDMRGPCPEGYHVPTYQELQKLVSAMQEMQPEAASTYPVLGINASSDMLEWILYNEYKGYITPNSGNPTLAGQGEKYILWSSEAYDANNAYSLVVEKGQPLSITGTLKSIGASLICFSDEEITELPSGSWDWTENFTNTALYLKEDSEGNIVYINYDNKTKWIKILFSSTLLNDNLYQWGNNTGISRQSGPAGVSTTQVDASGYGPGNYYSSNTFIAVDTDWSSVRNDNLWGGVSKSSSQYNLIHNSGVLSVNGQTGDVDINIPEGVTSFNGKTGDVTINSGEGIEIGTYQDYSAMRGPCPEGFHVPLKTEWEAVYNIWTALNEGSSNGSDFGIALKLPLAGNRSSSSASVGYQGTDGYYWSSSGNGGSAYNLHYYSSAIQLNNISSNSSGFSIRCFKDSPTIPTSSWTKLYGTSIESGGIFWSSTDGLISISSDGNTWITIADKNLGATTVWNSGDALSEANCGKYYQRGNNYGFPRTGSVTTSSTRVDASSYGPGNYYSSSTFIKRSSSPYSWTTVANENLRGGATGVITLENTITNTGVLSVNGQTGNVNIDASEASSITTTQPSNPVEGDVYYDTTNDKLKVYDGSQWNEVGSGGGDMSNYLAKNNTTAFTPTGDYNPATKKYVDDSVSAVSVPTKVSDLTNDSNFQTDTQVSQAISTAVASAYKYKGSVASYSSLPASGNTEGDVWNVSDTGMNYAWTGSAWDALGATVDMSNYIAKDNTTAFTPTGDYQPATKKYVDDNAGTEYNAGEGISIGDISINGRKGPSPDGFHVPSTDEWQGLNTIMTSLSLTTGDNWRINLHMPGAGNRESSDASLHYQGSYGYFWSSSPYSPSSGPGLPGSAHCLFLGSSYVDANYYPSRAYGSSVRCFKDSYETPDSTWTVVQGTLGSAGIFWNQSQGLISITDGSTGYTIMDKNLGATTVYNDGDTLTQANMGNMYQWGNNYGFPSTGTITNTSSTQVDASGYGPTNPYSSDTFITGSNDWSSVSNDDLWGDTTGTISQENVISNTGVLSVNGQTGNITIVTSEIVYVTQAEYDALPSTKLTDGKHYFIYE